MKCALGLALLGVLGLAACGGGATTPNSCTGVFNGPLIPAPPPVLYPNASFTGATNGGFNIVLAWQYGSQLELIPSSKGAAVYTQEVVVPAPTPLPGGATPLPSGPAASYFVPASSLASGTTYAITGFVNAACSGTQSTTLGTFATLPAPAPLSTTGQLTFPSNDGFAAVATYTLAAAPNGAAAFPSTQVGGTGLPAPFGANGPVMAAFTISVTKSVQLTQLSAWQITVPSTTTLSGAYALEFCSAGECSLETSLSVTGQTLVLRSFFGPPQTLAANASYIFELVPIPQFPPP